MTCGEILHQSDIWFRLHSLLTLHHSFLTAQSCPSPTQEQRTLFNLGKGNHDLSLRGSSNQIVPTRFKPRPQ